MVRAERGGVESVERGESRLRSLGETNSDGSVQLHHRRRRDFGERAVVADDAGPVGRVPRGRAGVARGDGGLELVRAGAVEWPRSFETAETAGDARPVPSG